MSEAEDLAAKHLGLPSVGQLLTDLAPLDDLARRRRVHEVIRLLAGASTEMQQAYRDAITKADYVGRQDWKSALAEAKKAPGDSRHHRVQAVRAPDGGGPSGLNDLDLDPANQATQLVDLTRRHFELFRSDDGREWAIECGGPNVALQLGRKGQFARRLARRYIEEYGTAPGDQAVGDAARIIGAFLGDDDPRPVSLRVARHDGRIVLDLGRADGKCVVVSAGEWEVVDRSPATFRRGRTGPLPVPVHGGAGLKTLRKLLNTTDDLFRLAVACLVCYLIPGIPYPIIAVRGEQGTAKTTFAKILIRCIDPGGDPGPLPRDERRFAVRMWNGYLHGFDNLTEIAPYQSDMLCRAATGDDYADRTLYSDDELTSMPYLRPIILTGIDLGAVQPDLAEREVPIELSRIAEGKRRTERTVIGSEGVGDDQGILDEFAAAHAEVLGALLDLLADVLTNLPQVGKIVLPRMADFGVVLAALDRRHKALHGEPHSAPLLGLYRKLTRSAVADSARDDVVGHAILAMMDRRDSWEGTATALLKSLVPFLPPPAPEKLPLRWPNPQGLGHRIPRLAPALREHGLEIDRAREGHNRDRTITITRQAVSASLPGFGATSSASSASSAHGADQPEHADDAADDWPAPADDAMDDWPAAADDAPPADDAQTVRDGSIVRSISAGQVLPSGFADDADDIAPETIGAIPETGPCTRCGTPCHRYGADARILCDNCHAGPGINGEEKSSEL